MSSTSTIGELASTVADVESVRPPAAGVGAPVETETATSPASAEVSAVVDTVASNALTVQLDEDGLTVATATGLLTVTEAEASPAWPTVSSRSAVASSAAAETVAVPALTEAAEETVGWFATAEAATSPARCSRCSC